MAAISEHLHTRPYQVATSTDPDLPLHKWSHRGTQHAVSHRSAAFLFGTGTPVESCSATGVVFAFPGLYVHVGFGG
jgi:hypothetical protein